MLQYNVKNAFIYTNIDADIYTILLIGVYKDNPKKCYYLKKALYSLKQSLRL